MSDLRAQVYSLVAGLYVISTDCHPALSVVPCTVKYTPFSCPDYCDKANVQMYFLSNVVGERSDSLLLREFCGYILVHVARSCKEFAIHLSNLDAELMNVTKLLYVLTNSFTINYYYYYY